jgi:hypothetical protein
LRFFDYGDEISFGEWIGMMLDEEIAAAKASGSPLTADQAIRIRWIGWPERRIVAMCKSTRPGARLGDRLS